MHLRATMLLLVAAACGDDDADGGRFAFASKDWDDGKAVVSVFRGQFKRYGKWRPAEVRDYIIREYLDPDELTKRDVRKPGLLPVLKVNRQITFTTGTYDYRLMHSLFFHRETGELIKAVGTSQEGCGIAFQRWDRSGRFSFDTYFEGEGRGEKDMPRTGPFVDEVPFLGERLEAGATYEIAPSLLRNSLRAGAETRSWKLERRNQRRCIWRAKSGAVAAEFVYDSAGFLLSWKIAGAEEFVRVARTRMYYWEHTGPGDEKKLGAR